MTTKRTTKRTSDLIDLLIARAPELAAAGVISLSVDGLSATLNPSAVRPPTPAPSTSADDDEAAEAPPSPNDPLNDPASYPGGRVPGFQRPTKG